MILGTNEAILQDGVAIFKKVNITEVTSHFKSDGIYLVIYPKTPTFS